MQLWPVTRRGFTEEGEDPVNNPVDNIRVGARFLKHLYDRYHERFEGVGTMKWLYGKNREGGCISICKFFFKFLYIWSVP